jgi:glycosyltransferase involved in cell wall biosynthesis
VTKNHEDIIEKTLQSIVTIGSILVADLGSNDKTISICEKFGANVYKSNFNFDYSLVFNNLAKKAATEWLFWLEPGEIVNSGFDYFDMEKTDSMYRVMNFQGDLLTKPTRIFKQNARFSKPVFCELTPEISEQTLPIVITGNTKPDYQTINECLVKWKTKEPLSPEPDYYEAFVHLMRGKYSNFLSKAEQFLFIKNTSDSDVVLTKYYMASLLRKNNPGRALQLILECIAAYPLMAEFWCQLGDLYLFSLKEYDRAYQFYENAIILGSQRLAEDIMPMEISKYEDYPKKMMDVVKEAICKTLTSKEVNSLHEELQM